MKVRLVLLLGALAAALAISGCGGGGDSGSDPATLAPPDSPVFIEVTKPEGQAAEDVDALARRIAGVGDLGSLIVSELESAANDSGNGLDYGKEIEPWLGERAGIFLRRYDGSDFSEAGIAVQVTDSGEAAEFVEKLGAEQDPPAREASYEGVHFWVQEDGAAVGVIGDFAAYGEDEKTFKDMVDSADGESLADRDAYSSAASEAPSDALADAFVDIGGLVDQAGGEIDPETEAGLEILGIEPKGATAFASLIPGPDRIEVDLSSDVLAEPPPSGDASALLGSLPADSVAAFASPQAGRAFGNRIDSIDRKGIPSQGVEPGQLKKVLKEAGIDLDAIASSIGDAAAFVEGETEASLGGALVLSTDSAGQAKNTVSSVGVFLRAAGVPGVTAIGGGMSGFSVHSDGLGPKPLVIAADGSRIAVAYGLPAARRAFAEPSRTLAESPAYQEAAKALGDTPIAAFADGPAALRLASALIGAGDRKFREAKPYLAKIDYLALGSESSDELAKARLIAGIGG